MANSWHNPDDDSAKPWSSEGVDWDPPDNPWDKSARNREWGTQGDWPKPLESFGGQGLLDEQVAPPTPPPDRDSTPKSPEPPSREPAVVASVGPPIPGPQPSTSHRGMLWIAASALAFFCVLGVWSSLKPTAPPPVDLKASATNESLENGRGLVEAGQRNLEQQEAEIALSQFRKAVEELQVGQAPAAEIWQARRWLAKATLGSKKYEEAHAAWTELAVRPEFSDEALKVLSSIAAELRKKANTDLDAAGSHLAQGDFGAAESLAQESLLIYRRYGGDRPQLGRAYGVIGSSLAKQGRVTSARVHLRQAAQYSPENASYRSALAALKGGLAEEAPKPERSKPVAKARASVAVSTRAAYPKHQKRLVPVEDRQKKNTRVQVRELDSDVSDDENQEEDDKSRTNRRRTGRSGDGDVVDTYRNGPVGGGSVY